MNFLKFKLFIITSFGLWSLAICENSSEANPNTSLDPSTTNTALKIYQLLSEESSSKNIIFSPFSISSVLAMILMGAKGVTAHQIYDVLFPQPRVKTNTEYTNLIRFIRSLNTEARNGTLQLANFVYMDNNYKLNPEYANFLIKHFKTTSKNFNFARSKDAKRLINQDVSIATKGKINSIINNIDPMTKLILINAISFKGTWDVTFDKNRTTKSAFFLDERRKVDADMMYASNYFKMGFSQELECEALELDYKQSNNPNLNLSMVFLLPFEGNNISTLEQKLTVPSVIKLLSTQMRRLKTKIWIPKFKLSSERSFVPYLKKMGISDLFDPQKSSLPWISDNNQDLYVGEFRQKVMIEVNEEGTTAAAVTVASFMARSLSIDEFRANRPFIFMLVAKNQHKSVILFIGSVKNPSILQ